MFTIDAFLLRSFTLINFIIIVTEIQFPLIFWYLNQLYMIINEIVIVKILFLF